VSGAVRDLFGLGRFHENDHVYEELFQRESASLKVLASFLSRNNLKAESRDALEPIADGTLYRFKYEEGVDATEYRVILARLGVSELLTDDNNDVLCVRSREAVFDHGSMKGIVLDKGNQIRQFASLDVGEGAWTSGLRAPFKKNCRHAPIRRSDPVGLRPPEGMRLGEADSEG
jgi:hypothetical protein